MALNIPGHRKQTKDTRSSWETGDAYQGSWSEPSFQDLYIHGFPLSWRLAWSRLASLSFGPSNATFWLDLSSVEDILVREICHDDGAIGKSVRSACLPDRFVNRHDLRGKRGEMLED